MSSFGNIRLINVYAWGHPLTRVLNKREIYPRSAFDQQVAAVPKPCEIRPMLLFVHTLPYFCYGSTVFVFFRQPHIPGAGPEICVRWRLPSRPLFYPSVLYPSLVFPSHPILLPFRPLPLISMVPLNQLGGLGAL